MKKCFVLIDLKTTKLTHQDIGQMDMYVRMFDDKYLTEGDNPTIGLILCAKKNETIAQKPHKGLIRRSGDKWLVSGSNG